MADHPFTLRQLEYFEAVAVHGTFMAAARQCHVSASGIAVALDELEKALGAQLLIRRKAKGVTLTPLGRQLLADARILLGDAGALSAHVRNDGSGIGGRLSVGCYPSLSPFYLPQILQGFAQAHPALALEFLEGAATELHDLLARGRIEVALMYSAHISAELEIEPIDDYHPHLLVAGDDPLAGRGSVRLAEVVDRPLIALDIPPSRENTERMFAAVGLTPHIAHRSMSFELVRCLVGRGLGYTLMLQRSASADTYDGHRVVALDIDDDVPASTVGLAYVAGSRLTGRALALLDYLRACRPVAGPGEVTASAAPTASAAGRRDSRDGHQSARPRS